MSFSATVPASDIKKDWKPSEKPEDSSGDEEKNECEPMPECKEPKPPKPLEFPMPDFCGLFDKAMAPLMSPPSIVVNINIGTGDSDPCKPPHKMAKAYSFLDGDVEGICND